jgi:hypothetical protein
MGWLGGFETYHWFKFFQGIAYLDSHGQPVYYANSPSSVVINPLVQWYFTGVGGAQIAIANEYHKYKHFARDGESTPPPGWSRAASSPLSSGMHVENLYITPDVPEWKFRFPIPLVDSSCSEITIPMPISNRITCQAEHAYFYIFKPKFEWCLHILDTERRFSGTMGLPADCPESHLETETRVELIAISSGKVSKEESPHILEDACAYCDGDMYRFYNVLWIEWADGVASRKAVGQITKAVWEAADREPIDVVLG